MTNGPTASAASADQRARSFGNRLHPLPWFAIRVRSNFEKAATQSLVSRGFEAFLPFYRQERKWSDRTKLSEFPLFPGYLFCRFDPDCRAPVLTTPGVLGVVGTKTDLLPVSETEIESVIQLTLRNIRSEPSPFIPAGQRVRVICGALAGIEGIVLQEASKCRLIIQISILQRSVAVQIDRNSVRPIPR